MPADTNQPTETDSVTQGATRMMNRTHGSFELAFAPAILALLGLWLDRTIGTVPVFTLTFAFLGILGAFAKVYYAYRHSMAEMEQTGPWVGHPRTEEFRAQAKARAERLSAPREGER